MNVMPHVDRGDRARCRIAPTTAIAGALILACTPLAHAGTGVASVQIRRTQNVGNGYEVWAIGEPGVNRQGGWAFMVSTTNDAGDTVIDHIFGNLTGGDGSFLRTQSTIGPYTQTSISSFFSINDSGAIGYTAAVNGAGSAWIDDTPIAINNEPSTIEDMVWRGTSVRGLSDDGQPYIHAGLASEVDGEVEQRGLFYGTAPTPLLLGGQVLPAFSPTRLHMTDTFAGASLFASSTDGTNYIGIVRFEDTPGQDEAVVMNGDGLVVDGVPVRFGNIVPASSGGLGGETWRIFKSMDTNNNGEYVISGLTDGGFIEAFIFKNGEMILRRDDVVDGVTLSHSVEDVAMNNDGDIVYRWSYDFGLRGLFVNDQLILTSDVDEVDWNNDGVIDPGYVLTQFFDDLDISDRAPDNSVTITFRARFQAPQSEPLAGFTIRVQVAPPFSIADFVTTETFQPPPDGVVDGADLAFLLGEWGDVSGDGSPADIVTSRTFQPPPDGLVDGADLAVLLGEWSP